MRRIERSLWVLGTRLAAAAVLSALSVATSFAQDNQEKADSKEPPEARAVPIQLIRPHSMTGWETADRPSMGWTVDGEKLIGGVDSKPLVSDWTFGDFTLELAWRTRSDGELQVRLEQLPGRKRHVIASLNEGKQSGRVTDGDRVAANGRPLEPKADEYHQTKIERHGDHLKVTTDGEVVADVKLSGSAEHDRYGLTLHVPKGVALIRDVTVTEPLGEPLFNGTDLTGWWSQKKQDGWKVENGELVGQRKGGNYLRSEREFGDFTLNFDYHISKGGNSGVGLRTPREGWPSREGMELQILDREGMNSGSQMSIYKHFPPLERPDQSGQWNNVVIKADGRIITAWVNGQIAQHRDTATHKAIADAPLSGWIGFQDHGAVMRIRNVYVNEAR